jgi:hypothetical protein
VYIFSGAKGNTLEVATFEVQRNIIGERVLGLPKNMSHAAGRK